MVEIIPVDDKLKQQRFCHLLGAHFSLSLMAYAAVKSGDPVGICQFEISDGVCKIRDAAFDRSITKTKIPIILLRSVIHYADECCAERVDVLVKNFDERIFEVAGFTICERGYYQIELQKFSH